MDLICSFPVSRSLSRFRLTSHTTFAIEIAGMRNNPALRTECLYKVCLKENLTEFEGEFDFFTKCTAFKSPWDAPFQDTSITFPHIKKISSCHQFLWMINDDQYID